MLVLWWCVLTFGFFWCSVCACCIIILFLYKSFTLLFNVAENRTLKIGPSYCWHLYNSPDKLCCTCFLNIKISVTQLTVPLKNSVPHFGNQQDLSIITFIMHMQYIYKYIHVFWSCENLFCMLKGSLIKSNHKARSK